MSIEVLNVELIEAKMKQNGWKRSFVIAQIGLKRRDGYPFLRGEWLPKDRARKALLLQKLSKLIGVGVPQILQRYVPARSAG